MLGILIVVLVVLSLIYDISFDYTENQFIMWYTYKKQRKYKILWGK